jgi:putative addiction module component (TIGR02574 family)
VDARRSRRRKTNSLKIALSAPLPTIDFISLREHNPLVGLQASQVILLIRKGQTGRFLPRFHARSDLLKRALALPIDERAALANTLLDTLESANESVSIKEAWDAEVARRIEDLKAGKAVTVPWEELHRELLAIE